MLTEVGLEKLKDRSGEHLLFRIADTSAVEYVYRTLSRYNRILPEKIRRNRKFRLWYLRAVIDRELAAFEGYPIESEVCQNAMKEVNEIYHASEKTKRWVCAPVNQ